MDLQEIMRRRDAWLSSTAVDETFKAELRAVSDERELEDRFYRDLEFGTGGLRGKLGAGTNRMNTLTVARATQGLANYLLACESKPSICVSFDTRNMSHEFAQLVASVLCANGIAVNLFDTVHPTPMLSFAVRQCGASAGVMITASHNPKEYNGYKVYGADGGQITDEAAAAILEKIGAVDLFSGAKTCSLVEAHKNGLLWTLGEKLDGAYFERVKNLTIRGGLVREQARNLKILYSPLNGAGNVPVRRVLKELGYERVSVVAAQVPPDGNFPTTPYPNPEDPSVYRLAIEQAEREHPDLIFATDPDCDRVGVLEKGEDGAYEVLSGNQVGALLCDYVLGSLAVQGAMPVNPAVIKTIVSSDLVDRICERYEADLYQTLTGFKYIGELAQTWSNTREHSFVFGFEESCGYLRGDFVRDKDAVIAAALIAETALYHKSRGKTLRQALRELYERHGWYAEKLLTLAFEGAQGQEQMRALTDNLRKNVSKLLEGESIAAVEDYQSAVRTDGATGSESALTLPRSNVLKILFADGSWFVLRPSGTEPKIKIYLSAAAQDRQTCENRLRELEELTRGMVSC